MLHRAHPVWPKIQRPHRGVEAPVQEVELHGLMIGVVPQVLGLARILLHIVELPETVAMVDDELISPVAVHDRAGFLRLVQGVEVFASYGIPMVIRIRIASQDR